MWPDIASNDAPIPARRRRRWRRLRRAALALLLLVALTGTSAFVASKITVDYLALMPGPVTEVDPLVAVRGVDAPGEDGEWLFLTVVMDEVTALDWILAGFDRRVDVRPIDRLRPPGESAGERHDRGRRQIDQSKLMAMYVALERLGYEATFAGEGAVLVDLVAGGPAVTAGLQVGDIILGLGGAAVSVAEDVANGLAGRAPGDTVDLTVVSSPEGDPHQVTVRLAAHPDDPHRGFLGVALDTTGLTVEAPLEVDIASQGVGGPSAGVMFTLAIIDHLTPADITRGHRIAGTGTIAPDGDVGPVGGVRQKTFAAIDAGAEFLLVPEENAPEALAAAGRDITVVPLGTIDDALSFLEALPAPLPG